MSIPYLLGTVFTADHDRVLVIGFLLHFASGWVFALLYALVFETLCRTGWLLGTGMGLMQALVVLATLMPIAPSLPPRMAGEYRGPEPTRAPGAAGLSRAQLRPPHASGDHPGAPGVRGAAGRSLPAGVWMIPAAANRRSPAPCPGGGAG